mgnify:CR=1 FL=1
MRRAGRVLAGGLALSLVACGGGAGAPPERGRDAEERAAAAEDPGEVGFWEPAIERGVRELADRVAAREGRPVLRITRLENRLPVNLDMRGFQDRLEASLTASGRFQLAESGSWAAADEAPDMVPQGTAASLRLSGVLNEDWRALEDAGEGRRASYVLTLQLSDARDGGVVAISRQKLARD